MRKAAVAFALVLASGAAPAQLSPRDEADLRRAEDLRRQALEVEQRALRLQEQEARDGWQRRQADEARHAEGVRRADEMDRRMRDLERRHDEAIRAEEMRQLRLRRPPE